MKCPYCCTNKTEFGYCKTTACINPEYRDKTYIIGTTYLSNHRFPVTIAGRTFVSWDDLVKFVEVHVKAEEDPRYGIR